MPDFGLQIGLPIRLECSECESPLEAVIVMENLLVFKIKPCENCSRNSVSSRKEGIPVEGLANMFYDPKRKAIVLQEL